MAVSSNLVLLVTTLCLLFPAQSWAWQVKDLGWFLIRNPAFTAVEPRPGGVGGYDLSISTFSAIPGTLDSNYIVRDIAKQLVEENDVRQLNAEELDDGLFWPNEVGLVPGEFEKPYLSLCVKKEWKSSLLL